MLENFILSQRAREAHYKRSETATYIGSGEETKRDNIGRQEKTNDSRIAYLVD